MNAHTSGIVLVLYSLFLLPSLCVGGILEHACGCQEEMAHCCEDHDGDVPDDPGDSGVSLAPHEHCTHFDSCDADLCTQQVRADEGNASPELPGAGATGAIQFLSRALEQPEARDRNLPVLPPGPALSRPLSDLPLLL